VKDLIEFMARSIVEEPDVVEVSEEPGEDGRVIIRLHVAEDDKGKIIGRQGRVAEAMRTLLRVAAIKGGTRASLEIP
jgi:hypothetical protein